MSATQASTAPTAQPDDPIAVARKAAIEELPVKLLRLKELPGVGDTLATNLRLAGFSTIPDIHHTDQEHLRKVDGVGELTATWLARGAASTCNYYFGDYDWQAFKNFTPEIARSK